MNVIWGPIAVIAEATLHSACVVWHMFCFSLLSHGYMSAVSETPVNKVVEETDQLSGWMSDTFSVVWSPSVS